MVELIVAKREANIPETIEEFEKPCENSQTPHKSALNILSQKDYLKPYMPEIALEVSSALESLVQKELPENSQKDVFAVAELNRFSEAVIKNEEESLQDNFFSSAEYLKTKDNQQTWDYAYSSDAPRSFYDSNNEQDAKIKEEVLEEIKSQKIANSWNVQSAERGNVSLAKKAAQELYKTINFTMNTILYDLAEA